VPVAAPATTAREALEATAAATRGASSRGARELLDQIYTDGFWADLDATAEPVSFRFNAEWQPPQWDGDAVSFPLALVVYRPLGFSEGSGANQPWLRHLRTLPGQRAFTAPVSINPADAPGIHEDDEIEVTSPYGAVSVRVRLDHRVKPGTLMMPLGGGHTAMGRWAKDVGVNPMQLVKSGPAVGSGGNAICTTRVRVARKGKA
jgi:anaerobic selenocysteine-containing dehydrogenase